MKPILITGSTGFIGEHLSSQLSKEGKKLILLSRHQADERKVLDLTDSFKVSELLGKYRIGTVVHLASDVYSMRSKKGVNNELSLVNNELNMAMNILSCLDVHCRFIYLSTAFEFASSETPLDENAKLDPANVYAQAKVKTRQMLEIESKKKGIELITLRPFLVYGPNQPSFMFMSQLRNAITNNETFIYSARTVIRDFLHVSDLIRAICLLINHKSNLSGTYNVGTGIGTSLSEVINMTEHFLGKNINISRDPGIGIDTPQYLVSNSDKLMEKVGWYPTINFPDSLSEIFVRE